MNEIAVKRGAYETIGLVESYAQKWAIGRAVRHIVGVKGCGVPEQPGHATRS